MGLDNFFTTTEQLPYKGSKPIYRLCNASFSTTDMGAFRGKIYFPLVQAMLDIHVSNTLDLWLFQEHNTEEIKEATEKFLSYDLNDPEVWNVLQERAHIYDYYGYSSSISKEELQQLIDLFEYYSQIENIKLIAFY